MIHYFSQLVLAEKERKGKDAISSPAMPSPQLLNSAESITGNVLLPFSVKHK